MGGSGRTPRWKECHPFPFWASVSSCEHISKGPLQMTF